VTVIVVGAAILYDGRVLAARRTPPRVGWELPGGKVEPGETAEAAVAERARRVDRPTRRVVALMAVLIAFGTVLLALVLRHPPRAGASPCREVSG